MLQYKLKHLCSRVIASLSAFGLFSINNSSYAATQLSGSFGNAVPGDYFTYTKVGGMTMNAKMAAKANCSIKNGAASQTIKSNVGVGIEKEDGTFVSGCEVTCKDGYYINGTSGYANSYYSGSTTGVYELDVPDSYCVPVASCSTAGTTNVKSGALKLNTNDAPTGSGIKLVNYAGTCTWTCKDGYSKEGGTNTTSTFVSESGVSVIRPAADCKARSFKVTFDCGTAATYGSTSNQTGVSTATYNSKFTIPDTATCKRDGYKFNGWEGSTN